MPCFYCGVRLRPRGPAMKTKDHVVPKSKGGTKTVLACITCNSAKRDMSLEQFRQKRGGIEFYGEMCARQEDEKTAWIYEFSPEQQDITPVPPSRFSSLSAIKRTIPNPTAPQPRMSNGLPYGLPDLRGAKFGGLTVLGWSGKKNWEVVCMCGSKEFRKTRAVKNPANTFDACLECRKPIGKLRSDYFKATGKDVSWEVCFQYLYENSAGQD